MDTTDIIKKAFSYPASNGEHSIYAVCWLPNDKEQIRAVLQISHGMAEHSERYDHFARYMVRNGWAVYANDHAGHGLSVNSKAEFGYFGAGSGRKHAVKDMHQLTVIAKKEYPDKPFFLLGLK